MEGDKDFTWFLAGTLFGVILLLIFILNSNFTDKVDAVNNASLYPDVNQINLEHEKCMKDNINNAKEVSKCFETFEANMFLYTIITKENSK